MYGEQQYQSRTVSEYTAEKFQKKNKKKISPEKSNSSKNGVYEVSLTAADFRAKPRQYIIKGIVIHHKMRQP